MELSEAIRGRRSTRMFDGREVDRRIVDQIITAATYAPSRMNTQPWHFHVATGESRKALGEVMAMTTAYLEEYLDMLGAEGVQHAARFYADLGSAPVVIAVSSPVSGDPNVDRDNAIAVGAAIQNLLLTAYDLGLSACSISSPHWVRDRLRSLFSMAEGWEIVSLIVLGYGAEEPHERDRRTDVVTYLT